MSCALVRHGKNKLQSKRRVTIKLQASHLRGLRDECIALEICAACRRQRVDRRLFVSRHTPNTGTARHGRVEAARSDLVSVQNRRIDQDYRPRLEDRPSGVVSNAGAAEGGSKVGGPTHRGDDKHLPDLGA